MAVRTSREKLTRFFKAVYLKLFRINDTPQRIALGLGIGVFCGVLPGLGPIAALALAFFLRVNRASALLGSVLTNTWMSIPVFLVSLKAGAAITGVRYQELQSSWELLIKDFRWTLLFDVSIRNLLWPILLGYAVISLGIGIITYAVALIAAEYVKRQKEKKIRLKK